MIEPFEIDQKTFLKQHYTLPALPQVVTQLLAMIHNEVVEIDEIANILSGDPALTAQILKIANSAYYGLRREIVKVPIAVVLLGLNEVYRMVLSLSVINTLAIDDKNELTDFWYHSFYTSLCTRYLGRKFEPLLSYDELWSASMLHNIGKLVLLKFYNEHYKVINHHCKEHGCLFPVAEKHFNIPSTSFMGTLLCDHWRLPTKVKQACQSHSLHDLIVLGSHDGTASFNRIICIGSLLAILSMENLNDETKQAISKETQKALNCSKDDFLTLMGDIYDLKTDVERFISQLV
jgi:HD-like signal output (HDOD) protein